jgi:hypothetical protein
MRAWNDKNKNKNASWHGADAVMNRTVVFQAPFQIQIFGFVFLEQPPKCANQRFKTVRRRRRREIETLLGFFACCNVVFKRSGAK